MRCGGRFGLADDDGAVQFMDQQGMAPATTEWRSQTRPLTNLRSLAKSSGSRGIMEKTGNPTRRDLFATFAAALAGSRPRKANQLFRPWMLARFSADVTPPIGHPCMGGGIAPASRIVDRLEAIGFVLGGGTLARPVVVLALDWCELRNDAYDRWREVLARTARTDLEHVLVTTVHQHDAPIADLRAQRMLEDNQVRGFICNRAFCELMVQRVARAMRSARPSRYG